jgi:hypothetical protein
MTTVFGVYRKTTAHWEDGTVKSLFVKTKGQGSKVLIEACDGKEPIQLGDQYALTLTVIAAGTPVPPIEEPEFPELPDNTLPEVPGGTPEHPIYKPPGTPEQPIYRPVYPEQPIYVPPGYPAPPIYLPGGGYPGQLPVFPGYPSHPIYLPGPGYPDQGLPSKPGKPVKPDQSLPEVDAPEVDPR